ncbi:uncharacterized protein LOC126552717 [Aphis gossypii]|uniref:uncharacterized protein LOC126552717 n=1 Tax=Aphis gossypii TaxID=80765 RepID=UPI0021590D74|nr:uncharacterized protein LOC126552717 [Aphis gossypii]
MPSCVEDNKLEYQSVVDVNDESEKSELNVIPNPFTQNNTNNFKDPTDWTNSNICRNYIAKFGYMIRTLMQILPHQNELILMMIVIVSTPDIANVDQLVIALRYVFPSGVPSKRFLIFILNSGHKSEEMSNVVMDFLDSHNIPIENVRGQSYDNVRNMSVLDLYNGLESYLVQIRDDFDVFKNKAVEITGCSEYAKDSKRKKKRKAMADELRSQPLTEITGKIDFNRNVYYVIIDTLKCQLSSRRQAYEKISDIYGCIPTLYKTPSSVATKELQFMFPNLEIVTCMYLSAAISIAQSHICSVNYSLNSKHMWSDTVMSFDHYIILLHHRLKKTPINHQALVHNVTLPAYAFGSGCERGFSILKSVNSYLRSTMKEERLNALAIFSIETELVEKLDFNDIINTFAHQKAN